MRTELLVLKLDVRATLPTRNNPTDAGFDVYCLNDCTIAPGETVRIKTGIAVQVQPLELSEYLGQGLHGSGINFDYAKGFNKPGGWTFAVLAWDKSGLASRGLKLGGGVIDHGYTGEIQIVVTNVGAVHRSLLESQRYVESMQQFEQRAMHQILAVNSAHFKEGDKLCNVLVQRVELPMIREVSYFPETDRGASGFGSSGR